MIVIQPEQIDVLERHMWKGVQQRLERAIAATFPDLSGAASAALAPGERVEPVVRRGVEAALRYGIEETPDLAAFIALGLAWRGVPPGTSAEWITRWLERPDLPGETKLAIIEAQLAATKSHPAFALLTQRVKQARGEVAGR